MILGRTELLLSGLYGELGPEQHASLEIVRRQTERLIRELEDLAAWLDEEEPGPGG